MRYLAPFFLTAVFLSSLPLLQAGETSIDAALEKARQRAGAPAADSQAKKEIAREAAQQKTREEAARKEREEAARKAKAEEEKAEANKSAPRQTTGTDPAAKSHVKVFTLKDGRQISAVMVVELDGTYALKDKEGKLEEVKKEDVQSIQDAE
jgi:hypothetical protein